MSFCILWSDPVNGMAITNVIDSVDPTQHRDSLVKNSIFQASQFVAVVDSATLPADMYFREAWSYVNGVIMFDLVKCRITHLRKLRKLRDKKLKNTDMEAIRRNEIGDVAGFARLKNYRQNLRTMPVDTQPLLDAALTPDDIRAVTPAIFNQPVPN